MIVLDTGAVYAFYDRDDAWHQAVRNLFENEPGQLILPSATIPELDYLIGKRLGRQARTAFLQILSQVCMLCSIYHSSFSKPSKNSRSVILTWIWVLWMPQLSRQPGACNPKVLPRSIIGTSQAWLENLVWCCCPFKSKTL